MIGAVLIALSVLAASDPPPHPTRELVGLWHGTSICTTADWNAACHDEEALYDAREGQAPNHVLLHGYKIVGGNAQFMGDLDFAWDEAAHAWKAEFSGPRVGSRWLFEVHGESLDGKTLVLPELRVGRTVHVTRLHGPSPWRLAPDP